MSSRCFVTTERCCRYPHARDTNPRISDLPRSASGAFQAFIDALVAASRKRPILVIVEDVQWMNPTTIELLVRVVANCPGERIMVLITHRDDYRADWLSGPAIRRIALQKLAVHECEQMVAAVAGSDFVPRRITSQIVEVSEYQKVSRVAANLSC
jgi:predicted ATPase